MSKVSSTLAISMASLLVALAIAGLVLSGTIATPGPAGPAGTAGAPGTTGPAGTTGATGPQGPAGSQGQVGATGAAGATGAQGPQGSAGAAGATGPAGPAGPAGAQGPAGPAGVSAVETLAAQPETCAICHKEQGANHQASYDELYQDGVIKVTDVTYTFSASPDTHTVTFKMTKNGVPFDGRTADALNIYFTQYNSSATQFIYRLSIKGTLSYDGAGKVTSTLVEKAPGASGYVDLVDLNGKNGLITVYGTDEIVQRIPNSRVDQGKYPFAAFMQIGSGVNYVSTANNAGCEKCHTTPFLKHGYIYGEVNHNKTTDFYICKSCHVDNGAGGHFDWQLLVDNPPLAASYLSGTALTAAQKAQYAYTTRLMNDVHMSHSMEFPYPQSMSNCVTCHDGKLNRTLTDDNFKLETCKSCHAVTGSAKYGTSARALKTILPQAIHGGFDLVAGNVKCNSCHVTGNGMGAPTFNQIHTGYDAEIYTANGQKFSKAINVTIDSASIANNKLTIKFSASESPDIPGLDVANISPTVLVGLYGYDTKDFIVGPHETLTDDNADGKVGTGDSRALEYKVGAKHPRLTTVSAAGGKWEVVADLSAWSNLIANNTVRRVSIAVLPSLKDPNLPANATDNLIALNAPSRVFNIATNAFADSFYKPIVDVQKCNACHDALAVTFHSPDRGGNIVACRSCHTTTSGGSHLEMQSRSIDSYIHSIHSMQYFDIGDLNFTDPVVALKYAEHTEMPFPKHGITDCESCHNKGTYEVPDQAKSLPSVLSASDPSPEGFDRDIGGVSSYVTGPASKACGGCHRAQAINEDNESELLALNQHMKQGGYLIEKQTEDANIRATWEKVVSSIMSMFD